MRQIYVNTRGMKGDGDIDKKEKYKLTRGEVCLITQTTDRIYTFLFSVPWKYK